jgi:anti-anti-sigma factor
MGRDRATGVLALSITDVEKDTFKTRSAAKDGAIVVQMRGNADIAAEAPLKKFLDDLHAEAKRLAIRETLFEVQELYFMNSSCLSLLLRHVNTVLQSSTSHAYKLRFRSNHNLRWQKRSLQALRAFAPDVVSIE